MSNRIENRAIRKVEDILDNEYLQTYFNSNDREPSWDGFINVHNEPFETKDTIEGRIPVQVKGNTTLRLDQKTFPIDVIDLKNYLHSGGVIYFVVSQIPETDMVVYYKSLTPNEIKIILDGKTEQKTINTKLEKFPENESKILELLHGFLDRSRKESSFSNEPLIRLTDLTDEDFNNGGSLLFNYRGKNIYSIFDKAKSGELGIYFDSGDSNAIPVPLENKIKNLQIHQPEQMTISISETEYYSNIVKVMSNSKQVNFKMGQSFTLMIDASKDIGKFEINMTTQTKYIEQDYAFLSALLKEKHISIDGYQIHFQYTKEEFLRLEQITKEYKQLTCIPQMLNKLNLPMNYDLKALDDSEINNLVAYAESIVNQKRLTLKKENDFNTYFLTNKLFSVLLYGEKYEDGWQFYNFFEEIDEDEMLQCQSKFSAFNKMSVDMINMISNFNVDYILALPDKWLKLGGQVTGLKYILLKLLNCYDSIETNNNDSGLLASLLRFSEWMIEIDYFKESPKIGYLNLLQIKYRMDNLTSGDQLQLFEIISDVESTIFEKFGAAVLLNNTEVSKACYESFSQDNQDEYKGYPITTLYFRTSPPSE